MSVRSRRDPPSHTAVPRQRLRLLVRGTIQGVGFRPFIYRLAGRLGLAGFVSNTTAGVLIEVEGTPDTTSQFVSRLQSDKPSPAVIEHIETSVLQPRHDSEFCILASDHDGIAAAEIPPDIAVCDDCLRELFDPTDRRYRYPFINCTNCGPRYTIVETIPYDRPLTSMKGFALCRDCEREYNDPLDRRFHAQPVACPICGPGLMLHNGDCVVADADPVSAAIAALRDGKIVAIRGLGGFHLAADAGNESAIQELRRRKTRPRQPFAIMVPSLDIARRLCVVSDLESEQLLSPMCPIVLLERKEGAGLIARSVAPENRYLGVMLPYTPLHHLLLAGTFDALVMTSGNRSEEPIAIGNEEARARLKGIADLFLLHNREILQRCDDSIVRCSLFETRYIRRARGYVPRSLPLRNRTPNSILGAGAELKNTVAMTRADRAVLSQHIGDLDNPLALRFFEECIEHLQRLLQVNPEVVACDLHPEYLSTKWALARGLPTIQVQHHHAHLAAVLAENNVSTRCFGLILDGTGYGDDGTIWGGEVLLGDLCSYQRLAWLEPIPLPGGEAAIRQPWRMSLSYLRHTFGGEANEIAVKLLPELEDDQRETILNLIDKRVNAPLTSSCGRLFDGVAALLGLCQVNTFEAEAAMAVEMAAMRLDSSRTNFPEIPEGSITGSLPIDWLVRQIVAMRLDNRHVGEIATSFHLALGELFIRTLCGLRTKTDVDRVALSGGVFQNQLLLEYVLRRLPEEGFTVYTHRQLPCNDGCISYGQVAVAAARLR